MPESSDVWRSSETDELRENNSFIMDFFLSVLILDKRFIIGGVLFDLETIDRAVVSCRPLLDNVGAGSFDFSLRCRMGETDFFSLSNISDLMVRRDGLMLRMRNEVMDVLDFRFLNLVDEEFELFPLLFFCFMLLFGLL